MLNNKVLLFIVGVSYVLYNCFLFTGHEFTALCFIIITCPIIMIAYLLNVKNKSVFFLVFLILQSVSDVFRIITTMLPVHPDVNYYAGNILYILSYVALIIDVAKSMFFRDIIKNYKFSIIVLTILSVYIARVLLKIVNPYLKLGTDYVIEITYNISILLLLSLAILNFFHKDDKKAFFILLGAVCIVFSEVLNIAYVYVSNENLFNFFTITFSVTGILFLYEQSKIPYKNYCAIINKR